MTAITTPSQVNTANNLGNNNSDPSVLQENVVKVKQGSDKNIENIDGQVEKIKNQYGSYNKSSSLSASSPTTVSLEKDNKADKIEQSETKATVSLEKDNKDNKIEQSETKATVSLEKDNKADNIKQSETKVLKKTEKNKFFFQRIFSAFISSLNKTIRFIFIPFNFIVTRLGLSRPSVKQ